MVTLYDAIIEAAPMYQLGHDIFMSCIQGGMPTSTQVRELVEYVERLHDKTDLQISELSDSDVAPGPHLFGLFFAMKKDAWYELWLRGNGVCLSVLARPGETGGWMAQRNLEIVSGVVAV